MILKSILEDFPLRSLGFYMPDWIDALPDQNTLKKALMSAVKDATQGLVKIRDIPAEAEALEEHELISQASITNRLLGMGAASLRLSLPRSLYYQTLSEETGLPIENDGDLIETLSSMAAIRADYEKLRKALADVRETGYGVVFPDPEQMVLEEPKIVRQNGKYGVKLRASAPAIHLLMTQVETEVNPAIGGENASEDIIGFLLQGFDGDVNRIWESNIFGRSLNELAEEALRGKIDNLPENARMKLKNTLQRIINEGSSGLICILL